MSRENLSADSLIEATRSRAKFSGHGSSKGAAGYKVEGTDTNYEFLSASGQTSIINPRADGFGTIRIGAAWDMMKVRQKQNIMDKALGRTRTKLMDVDLDLGCLYEMQDGSRGALQAFGNLYGAFDRPPFIRHSGDEREGDEEGDDEYLEVNGSHWADIKRILVYVYIYDGAPHWASVKPQIQINVPGETPMVVTPGVGKSELPICVIGAIENVRNGIKLENFTEYYPGHAEMSRAFGWGLSWEDGKK
ncbi:MAG: TerD family protein [Rhodospirillales bacterium]|nr:TerD family protein [Rhodospirillales bacterium]